MSWHYGENGAERLKIRFPQGSAGSSPAAGTNAGCGGADQSPVGRAIGRAGPP